jgi:hypothetical protein
MDEPVAVPEAVQTVEPTVDEAVVTDAPPARSSWLDRLRDRR